MTPEQGLRGVSSRPVQCLATSTDSRSVVETIFELPALLKVEHAVWEQDFSAKSPPLLLTYTTPFLLARTAFDFRMEQQQSGKLYQKRPLSNCTQLNAAPHKMSQCKQNKTPKLI